MTDKEVGELWKTANVALATSNLTLWPKAAIDLIRKLVEERAKFYGTNGDWTHFALKDFGINPEDFK